LGYEAILCIILHSQLLFSKKKRCSEKALTKYWCSHAFRRLDFASFVEPETKLWPASLFLGWPSWLMIVKDHVECEWSQSSPCCNWSIFWKLFLSPRSVDMGELGPGRRRSSSEQLIFHFLIRGSPSEHQVQNIVERSEPRSASTGWGSGAKERRIRNHWRGRPAATPLIDSGGYDISC